MTSKFTTLLISFGMLLTLAAAVSADPSRIVADGATLQQAATGFAFTEGPAADKDGNIYFTDQPNDRIMKWTVDGKITTFLSPCGRSNGLCVDRRGNILACADEHNQFWRIDTNGKSTVLIQSFDGNLLDGPNDVWERPEGGIYITDPMYWRSYWHRGPAEQTTEGVYYLDESAPPTPDAPGGKLTRVVDDMNKPNGIIGTPDGKTLYVSDIGAGQTFAYDIEKDGSLTHKRLFCSMGSDGMTIDSAGDIYLTGHGVTIFDSKGNQIDHIDINEGWTGNICFGGKDRKTLFITASHSVYTLQMKVHGVGSQ